jgi:hypothetical protein
MLVGRRSWELSGRNTTVDNKVTNSERNETDRVARQVPWYPTSREKRARCGAPDLLAMTKGGVLASLMWCHRGTETS